MFTVTNIGMRIAGHDHAEFVLVRDVDDLIGVEEYVAVQ